MGEVANRLKEREELGGLGYQWKRRVARRQRIGAQEGGSGAVAVGSCSEKKEAVMPVWLNFWGRTNFESDNSRKIINYEIF